MAGLLPGPLQPPLWLTPHLFNKRTLSTLCAGFPSRHTGLVTLNRHIHDSHGWTACPSRPFSLLCLLRAPTQDQVDLKGSQAKACLWALQLRKQRVPVSSGFISVSPLVTAIAKCHELGGFKPRETYCLRVPEAGSPECLESQQGLLAPVSRQGSSLSLQLLVFGWRPLLFLGYGCITLVTRASSSVCLHHLLFCACLPLPSNFPFLSTPSFWTGTHPNDLIST